MPDDTDSRLLLEHALSYATAEHVTLSLHKSEEASTRFANNAITQNIARREATLHVTAAFGNRVGNASGNDFSDDGIRRLVARAEAISRESSPDPEFVPPPEPASYRATPIYAPETRAFTPDEAAVAIVDAIRRAEKAEMTLAGSLATGYSSHALMNHRGLFAEYEATSAQYVNTAIAEDSSGWATSAARSIRDVDVTRAVETAIHKAKLGAKPREAPPGRYTVVLEPDATADFLGSFYGVLDAKAAHEGRSCLSGKEGARIGGENVTISSLPTHPLAGGSPIIEAGLPAPDVHWIEKGALTNLSYSRFWAQKTGHAVAQPVNFVMTGGDMSLEALIASTERGILVTRFWYIRFVDPMKFLLTGMTRDGLFWIEDGAVCYGIKNLRFNDSPLRVFNAIEGMSPSARVGGLDVVPALKVRDFQFTSGTSF